MNLLHLSSPSVFSGVRFTRSLIFSFRCMFCRSLFIFVCTFSFGHCVVCSSIYGFWLPLLYLQTLLILHHKVNGHLLTIWMNATSLRRLKNLILHYIPHKIFFYNMAINLDDS
jgi:hypothetical protein